MKLQTDNSLQRISCDASIPSWLPNLSNACSKSLSAIQISFSNLLHLTVLMRFKGFPNLLHTILSLIFKRILIQTEVFMLFLKVYIFLWGGDAFIFACSIFYETYQLSRRIVASAIFYMIVLCLLPFNIFNQSIKLAQQN